MSIAHILLMKIPPLVLCLVMMAAAAAVSVVGTFIFHRFVSHRSLKTHNDITGPIFSTLGVIYAVLLGFIVVVVWQGFDRARMNADMEINCLANLYMDSELFEQGFRDKVRSGISAYTKEVIDEWDMHAVGKSNPRALETIRGLNALYSRYQAGSESEKIFLEKSIEKIDNLLDLRILRMSAAGAGIHGLLWFVLIVGGAITIIFTIFFGTDNLNAKVLMSALLAMLISLVLFTILEFSLPFVGSARVSCEPFKVLAARIGA